MPEIQYKSLKDILKESVEKCKTTDEKIDKILYLFVGQAKLLDYVIDSLPEEKRKEIAKKIGFREVILD
jgi:hypothetical protein